MRDLFFGLWNFKLERDSGDTSYFLGEFSKINPKRDLICNFVPPIFKYLQKWTGFKNNGPGFSIRLNIAYVSINKEIVSINREIEIVGLQQNCR